MTRGSAGISRQFDVPVLELIRPRLAVTGELLLRSLLAWLGAGLVCFPYRERRKGTVPVVAGPRHAFTRGAHRSHGDSVSAGGEGRSGSRDGSPGCGTRLQISSSAYCARPGLSRMCCKHAPRGSDRGACLCAPLAGVRSAACRARQSLHRDRAECAGARRSPLQRTRSRPIGMERRTQSRSSRIAGRYDDDGDRGCVLWNGAEPQGGAGMRMNFHRLPAWLLFGLVLIAAAIIAAPGASYSHQDRDQPLAIASCTTRLAPTLSDAIAWCASRLLFCSA